MSEVSKVNPEKNYTKEELESLTSESLTELKKQIKDNNKKASLLTLIYEVEKEKSVKTETVETKIEVVPVKMEDLKNSINSPAMKKILTQEVPKDILPENNLYPPKNIFDLFATQKLLKTFKWLDVNEIMWLEPYLDSIKLIMWKRLMTSFKGSSIWSITSGLIDWVIPNNEDWKWINLNTIKTAFEDIKNFSQAKEQWTMKVFSLEKDKSTNKVETKESFIKAPISILNLAKSIELIVENEAQNSKRLFELAKSKNFLINWEIKNESFKKLLNSPTILDELLEKWVYNWNWFNIDLKSNTFNIEEKEVKSLNPIESKQEFLDSVTEITNEAWATIDETIKWVEDLADWIKKWTWYDVRDIKNYINWMEDWFIKTILWMLFWLVFGTLDLESESSDISKDSRKDSIENLISLYNDNENKSLLPEWFNLWQDEKTKEDEYKSFSPFFNRVEETEKARISKLWAEATEKQKNNQTEDLIQKSDFWEKILNSENDFTYPKSTEYKIEKAVQKIRENKKDMKWEDFLKELNELKIEEKQATDTLASLPATAGATGVLDESWKPVIKDPVIVPETNKAPATVKATDESTPIPAITSTPASTPAIITNKVTKAPANGALTPTPLQPVVVSTPTLETSEKVLDKRPLIEQLTNIQKNPLDINVESKVYTIEIWKNIKITDDKWITKTYFVSIDTSRSSIEKYKWAKFKKLILENWSIYDVINLKDATQESIKEEPEELEEKLTKLIKDGIYTKTNMIWIITTISQTV